MARNAIPEYTVNQLITASHANTYWKDNEAAHWASIAALEALVLNRSRVKVYNNGGFSSTTTLADVSWTGENFDTDNMWNIGNPTRITIMTAGLYLVTAYVGWSSGTAGSYRHAGIYVNNNTGLIVSVLTVPAATAGITTVSLAGLYLFTASDYMQLKLQSGEAENVSCCALTALRMVI